MAGWKHAWVLALGLLPIYLAAGLYAQSPAGQSPAAEAYVPVASTTPAPVAAPPATSSAPASEEHVGTAKTDDSDANLPDLQMDSPTHFHEKEWIILNAVKDRTHEMFDPATNLMLRKTSMMAEKYFPVAKPITRLDLLSAPIEYRARFIKLNVQFLHSKKLENRPANCTYDGPLYQIVCQDPVTGDNVLVLSPQDSHPSVRFKEKCTVVGFFDKLLRFKTAALSEENGNPESTFILIVGWIRPYEPRPGVAGEAAVTPAGAGATPSGEGNLSGSMGTLIVLLVALVFAYFFIRSRSGGTAGSFMPRSTPLKVPTRSTSVPNDPAYTEPIDLTAYGKEKKKDDPNLKN